MTYINPFAENIDIATGKNPEELRALARMIVFARQNAIDLNLQNAVHCLDLALRSVLQEGDSDMEGLTFDETESARRRAH